MADGQDVMYLDWVENSGSLSGTAQIAEGGTGTAQQQAASPVTTTSVQLTGSESSGKISLQFGGSILGTSASGTIQGSKLVLDFTDSTGVRTEAFTPGTSKIYNADVAALTAKDKNAITTDARNAAEATLNGDIADFGSEESALVADAKVASMDLTGLKNAWAAQSAYSHYSGATCLTSADQQDESAKFSAVTAAINQLGTDLSTIEQDLASLKNSIDAAGAVNLPMAEYTTAQDEAVRTAGNDLTSYGSSISQAQRYQTSIQNHGQDLDNTIQAIQQCSN